MSKVRKEIRRVLDDMGFDNSFDICTENPEELSSGEPLVVTIHDWHPHPDALNLKKKLKYCTDRGCVDVHFDMNHLGI